MSIGIIIDIVIVLFILASAYLGYKKGLIELGVSLVAFLVAIVIAFILYRPIGNIIINTTEADDKLQETIETNIQNIVAEDTENKTTNGLIKSAKEGILPEASRSVAINIIYGITLLALFVIARICLIFVTSIANLIAKLPLLKQINETGGIVYGLLRGLVITYAILMIINLVVVLNPKAKVNKMIENTYIAKAMSSYNILNAFFK